MLGVRYVLKIELVSERIAGWHVALAVSLTHRFSATNLVDQALEFLNFLGVGLDFRLDWWRLNYRNRLTFLDGGFFDALIVYVEAGQKWASELELTRHVLRLEQLLGLLLLLQMSVGLIALPDIGKWAVLDALEAHSRLRLLHAQRLVLL